MNRMMTTRWPAHTQVAWWMRRLQMMSPCEVALRARDRGRCEVWRRRTTWPAPRFVAQPALSSYRLPSLDVAQGGQSAIQQAESMLDGRLVALGQTFALGEVRWGLDPQSGRTAPLQFGPHLDYRDRQLVGNARNTWELNRHQHLTLAALAYALTGDERFARFVRRQLETWLDQDPFPLGVNWASPLELGLRLISWIWVSRFLAGSAERDVLFGPRGLLWPSVYQHQWMIAKLHSVGSSANNHLIGEMAGLFTSAVEWPWFDESPAWTILAQRSLEAESARQFYPSGVNREQAFGYHLFAVELLLVAALEGERAGRPFSHPYRSRLHSGVRAAAAQIGPHGLPPTYGDYDDGVATGLPRSGGQVLDRIAAVTSQWLPDTECGIPLSPESRLAAQIQLSGVRVPEPATPPRTLPAGAPRHSGGIRDAGLYMMRSVVGDEEVFVLADAGELGYLSIAAHGHADALSFTLAVGDEQLLVDPGTFSYHYEPAARAYFRSTRAHNTIAIDGQDQSQASGPFLWTRKARTTLHEWHPSDGGATLAASHDGYERLASPVTHRRTLILDGGHLTVDDELDGEGEHDIEWRLHLAPGCIAQYKENTCDVRAARHRLSIELDTALQWDRVVADERGGWYSRAFNQREKTTTLLGSARLAMPARLRHVMSVGR